MSHDTSTYPHPVMAFVGLALTLAGVAAGKTGWPFADVLQYTAWITGILAAVGSMLKINYRKAIISLIRKIL